MICHFLPELSPLFFYSCLSIAVLTLLIGILVIVKNPKALTNRLFFLISLCFSSWTIINLIARTNTDSQLIMSLWPFLGVLSALIVVLSVYFTYAFLTNQDIGMGVKTVLFILVAPTLLFAHTNLSVSGFNLSDCTPTGFGIQLYNIFLGTMAIIWVLVLLTRHWRQANKSTKKTILLTGMGIEAFLLSFLATANFFTNSNLEFYGLFIVFISIAFIGILIARFKTSNLRLVMSYALPLALLILVSSQLAFVESTADIIATTLTLILTVWVGIMLLQSVKQEEKQKSELEIQSSKLKRANKKLRAIDKQKSEFVSIASHQLRNPLTAIRGYVSMLLEGNYGKIPKKAQATLSRVEEAAKLMALGIEDYLNVSRIESGNMRYSLSDFNLKEETDHLCDQLRIDAIKHGLGLIFRSDIKSRGVVHADIGKTLQILQNLIHNAIKYTDKGSIKILVRDDVVRKKIFVDIEDTGIGLNQDDLDNIFHKFERAKSANSINVSGTGLGLFVSLKMAEAMGGTVTASSDGKGKGSIFTLELPLAM